MLAFIYSPHQRTVVCLIILVCLFC